MKKILLVIVCFLLMTSVVKADTLSRFKIPTPKLDNIVTHIGIDKFAHFGIGYMLQDISYNFLFTKKVHYTINGKDEVVKEGKKYGKTESIVLNMTWWICKEKYVDSHADWKDAGASSLGIGTWLIRKQF